METPDAAVEIRDGNDVPPEAVLGLFRHAEWARHRTRESVARVLARTPVVLTAWAGGRCVGLVRVLTDGAYRALVEDVVVHPDHRGQGVGRRLMEAALAHPEVRDVEVVFLFAGVPAFYAGLGFVPDAAGMKLERPAPPRGG